MFSLVSSLEDSEMYLYPLNKPQMVTSEDGLNHLVSISSVYGLSVGIASPKRQLLLHLGTEWKANSSTASNAVPCIIIRVYHQQVLESRTFFFAMADFDSKVLMNPDFLGSARWVSLHPNTLYQEILRLQSNR